MEPKITNSNNNWLHLRDHLDNFVALYVHSESVWKMWSRSDACKGEPYVDKHLRDMDRSLIPSHWDPVAHLGTFYQKIEWCTKEQLLFTLGRAANSTEALSSPEIYTLYYQEDDRANVHLFEMLANQIKRFDVAGFQFRRLCDIVHEGGIYIQFIPLAKLEDFDPSIYEKPPMPRFGEDRQIEPKT